MVTDLSTISAGVKSLPRLLGGEVTEQQAKQLCVAALPLNIDGVTPERFLSGDQTGMSNEQQAAWANFFDVIERFQ
ncbi:hypothetical protein PhaeoP18_01015 [Phaeobacter piscinae]|uniref:Uncharacterized protein n=2 Tax=Phaeobacter piscinae TaxID=1580596 RepID=A0AAN1GQ06_9RHOB|nr:hypothetical protein PhaeoP13_01030 [Phaeobacter piscinae]AUR35298.1 hypothetical protein PhaeoP18_01015 [Phaeobacter piscinae]